MIELQPDEPQVRHLDDKIIPMINVIFLLLIFFLIAGSLTELEREGVRPPRSETAPVSGGSENEWLLRADGLILADGREFTLEQFREWLSRPGASIPRSQQLRADANAPARELLPLMQLLRERGVERMALVTVSERDSG
jgi:biopolymer transport protein ExbD